MKLVDDWRQAWKWASVHAMTAALAVQGAWVAIPAEMQAYVHPVVAHALTAFLLLAGIVGRVVEQAPKADDTDKAGA